MNYESESAFISVRLRLMFFALLFAAPFAASAQTLKVAVLNVDEARMFQTEFRRELAAQKNLKLIDDDLSRAARNALKPENLFNLSLEEAKNLGAAIDCDFFFVVKSENLRRSSSAKPVYYESYAVIFLASKRSGRLIGWEHAIAEADKPETADKQLLAQTSAIAARFLAKIVSANDGERAERQTDAAVKQQILEISDAETENLRVPLPYKRLRPAYTAAASLAEIEATIDAAVELNEKGETIKIEIVRWAGFDLDEATVETIKKMQFRPAVRDGELTASRFLLRYNFRRPRE